MRNAFIYLTLLLTSFTTTYLTAIEGPYAGMLGGINELQKDHQHGYNVHYKTGYALGIFGGYELSNAIRVEGELTYRRNHVQEISFGEMHKRGGHRRSISLMANALYDVELYYPIVPYIGAGLGVDWDRLSAKNIDSHKSRFAMQAIMGVTYPITDVLGISVDYRFHWAMYHRYNHTLLAGFRQAF